MPLSPSSPLPLRKDHASEVAQLRNEVSSLRRDLRIELQHLRRAVPLLTLLDVVTQPEDVAAELVRRVPPAQLFPVARLSAYGPVGRVGNRRALRAVAFRLLSTVLQHLPHHIDALALRGELLLPYIHYGLNDPRVPRSTLQVAYSCFHQAAVLESSPADAAFLKGRWLLSMEPLHRDDSQAAKGRHLVKKAAANECPRALVFLAHRYEYPELDGGTVSFASDVPKGKLAKERLILDLYQRAAAVGNKDALNDVGTSYAQAYGGLQFDFDKAVEYYVRAINVGSIHAYDNLGTHYETGMGGRYPSRVDFGKALYYYRQGTFQRCPKCANNLAAAYEEGMQHVLDKDLAIAERYYYHSILLADDSNDLVAGARSVKDLSALLITRIKLADPKSHDADDARAKLDGLLSLSRSTHLLANVDLDIQAALRGRSAALKEAIGEENAYAILNRAKSLSSGVATNATAKELALFHHVMGKDAVPDEPSKKKKSSSKRAPKRRRKS